MTARKLADARGVYSCCHRENETLNNILKAATGRPARLLALCHIAALRLGNRPLSRSWFEGAFPLFLLRSARPALYPRKGSFSFSLPRVQKKKHGGSAVRRREKRSQREVPLPRVAQEISSRAFSSRPSSIYRESPRTSSTCRRCARRSG